MAQGSSTESDSGVRRLGPYEIHAGLSVGGMAELYLASLRGPGGYRKFVALKKILADVQSHDRFARMFRDEAHITAALSHKNIAQVHDLGEAEDGELYLAMEYILGMDVGRILRACRKLNEPLPIGLSVRIVRDVCTALDYAHRFLDREGQPSPIVHRDITPKNVMVGYDGQVKVIDFGVALAKNKLDVTAVGTIKGTAAYMSPEQVRGKRLDGRSDLYSAGVVLHELLTGQRLFSAKMEVDLYKQILSEPLPPVRELNPGVPERLAEVLERALSRDPAGRFESGMQMAEALHFALPNAIFDTSKTRDFMCSRFADKLHEARAVLKGITYEQERETERRRDIPEELTSPGSQLRGATVVAVDGNAQRLQRL
ncbi:MAG TPA: serine/threonine-protein kinase, partial [Myxococcaceae bacterium]|nr:serine/threonine-protein kinase [Myxococcaceae bacterium]